MTSKLDPTQVRKKQEEYARHMGDIVARITDPKTLKKSPLLEADVTFILDEALKRFKMERTAMVEIQSPVFIMGDTHGQYRDVLRMLDKTNWIADPSSPNEPKRKYLFLGDYVDRGPRSIEVMCLVLTLRLIYPDWVYLLRGNHEAKEINKSYGFHEEVTGRFNEDVWVKFNEVFKWMPLVALINQTIICMHGGIPKKHLDKDLDDLRNLKLPINSPRDNEIVADLLWSDPSDEIDGWQENPRGLGRQFGQQAWDEFKKRHGVQMIVRAHQVFVEGYKWMLSRQCLTVFSAPNYGGQFGNNACCLLIDENGGLHFYIVAPMDGSGAAEGNKEKTHKTQKSQTSHTTQQSNNQQ